AVIGDDPAKQREQDVERLRRRGGDEHVAFGDPAELGRASNAARRTFVHAFTGSEPIENFCLVLSLGAAEEMAQGNEDSAHDAADQRGQGSEIWRRRFWWSKGSRNVFVGAAGAVCCALGEFISGWAAGT